MIIDFQSDSNRTWWWPFHYLLSCIFYVERIHGEAFDTWERALLTTRQGFVPYKGSLAHKVAIVSTVQFNFINFAWFNNGLVDNASPNHHTSISLLPYSSPRHVWMRKSILWPIHHFHKRSFEIRSWKLH